MSETLIWHFVCACDSVVARHYIKFLKLLFNLKFVNYDSLCTGTERCPKIIAL